MGKILLNLGYLDLNDKRFYLTDVNMLDQQSKADTSNPENNNEIMTGKSTWQFSATIFKNEAINIPPGIVTAIRLIFGGQAWYGPGVIIQSSLVGKIDNAVIYNVTGEFTAGSRHLELIFKDAGQPTGWVDSFQWMDDNNDGVPNGMVFSGSPADGSISILSNLYHRQLVITNKQGGPIAAIYNDVNFKSGSQYRFYIRYFVQNTTSFHSLYLSPTAFISLSNAVGLYEYDSDRVATAGWDRLKLLVWGDLSFPAAVRYYFVLIGKVINFI